MSTSTISDVLIIGGGAAGLACASSFLRRRADLSITVVDPADTHFYQPGWTLVGAGVFKAAATRRSMISRLPSSVAWVRDSVTGIDAGRQQVTLYGGRRLGYRILVVATGLKLDWAAIPGLSAALGQNGVTSNYRADLAPYTWQLVQRLREGTALFTQPPMPIKCAGAPQKALYLACDHWRRHRRLDGIRPAFHSAAPTLFGVPEYVPSLMRAMERYNVDLQLRSTLVEVNGEARVATFKTMPEGGDPTIVERRFDMLHVVPPQVAPDLVRNSELADASGFVAVDQATLRHRSFPTIFALGDVIATTNAKTAAAVRKQAPVVAANIVAALAGEPVWARYDGYGSCPLTVARGKIVLAEFGYGGVLLPTFPKWLLDGQRPSSLAWLLKRHGLPALYWHAMLKGREWLARPAGR